MLKKKILIIVSVLGFATIALVLIFGFKQKPTYTVTFDANGGTEVYSVNVIEGNTIKEPSSEMFGYEVSYWSYNYKPWDFDKDTVKSNMKLVANWVPKNYKINYNLAGGRFAGSYPESYTIESQIYLSIPIKNNNVFAGWFNDENKERIDRIVPGNTGDLTLSAVWVNNVVVESSDTSRGNVGLYAKDENASTLTAYNLPVNDKYHLFKGWYDANNKLLSEDNEYTFELVPNVQNYIRAKYMNDVEEYEWDLNHGVIPQKVSGNDNYTLFGMYPQSNVNDSVLIEKLELEKETRFNSYRYYNHEYYARRRASLARDANGEILNIHNFDNGIEIIDDKYYWFKLEPIKWKIIDNSNGESLLLCNNALDIRNFNDSSAEIIVDEDVIFPNDYSHSSIRSWLNNGFYNIAFKFNDSPLLVNYVDNSSLTTSDPEQTNNYENTEDKVFLLSYKDYTNEQYGFSSSPSASNTRMVTASDFARASRCSYGTETSSLYSAYLYTRSSEPSINNNYSVTKVNKYGLLNKTTVNDGQVSHQPAIRIVL